MKIVNYGSINLDHVYQVDHIVQPGETLLAAEQNLFCGGKGLNQSIALAKAGAEIFHAGVVGEDGDILLDALRAARVDISHVRRAPGASAHTVIQVDRNGQNCIIVFSGENVRPTEADIDGILADFSPEDAVLMQNADCFQRHGIIRRNDRIRQRQTACKQRFGSTVAVYRAETAEVDAV